MKQLLKCFVCVVYKMDTEFEKVIADLRNLREDVKETTEDYELELEVYRSDMRQHFYVKVVLGLSMFINGLLVGHFAMSESLMEDV
jgi:hypothetical protein